MAQHEHQAFTAEAAPTPLLRVEHLHAFYGKSHVLHGVNFHVMQGEIVALLGRNGSGRSTLAKAVMGVLGAEQTRGGTVAHQTPGRVLWRGKDILGMRAYAIARLGIGYVPESRDIFPTLTVHQNLLLGQKRGVKNPRWTTDAMYQMFPQLQQRRDTEAGVLSGGEQQMLTLCRTLMGEPALIIIDEPTEGLAPKVVELVAQYLQNLKAHGVSVLLIEQKLTIALGVAQRCLVMGRGCIVFDGTPQQLRADGPVRQEWLQV